MPETTTNGTVTVTQEAPPAETALAPLAPLAPYAMSDVEVATRTFELAQRKAKLYSESTLVPKDFQRNIANCLIAMNLANRLAADELMVMQNLYVVHGRPGWSSQFLIATCNQSGRFSAIRFEFFGAPGTDGWGCRAWATEKATGERLQGADITIALAKKEGWFSKTGSKWASMPQQMLMYRSAAWFVRVYAPELAMGLPTAEELRDTEAADWRAPVTPAATLSPAEMASGTIPLGLPPLITDDTLAAAAAEDRPFDDEQPAAEREPGEDAELMEADSWYLQLAVHPRIAHWRKLLDKVDSLALLSSWRDELYRLEPDGASSVRMALTVPYQDAMKRVGGKGKR